MFVKTLSGYWINFTMVSQVFVSEGTNGGCKVVAELGKNGTVKNWYAIHEEIGSEAKKRCQAWLDSFMDSYNGGLYS